ncbi:MAG: ABC transporter permease, partial [Acidobacteriota bacterium]
ASRAWRCQAVDGGRRVIADRGRWHRWLLRIELAIALVLVATAGLIISSFVHLIHIDPGFRTDGVETVELRLPRDPGAPPSSVRFAALVEAVEALPQVASAGLVNPLPMSGRAMGVEAHTSQHPEAVRVGLRGIDPGFLTAFGILRVAGRDFDTTDLDAVEAAGESSIPPVLVSRDLARRLWPDREAIGRELRLSWGAGLFRVVGVVRDIRSTDLSTSPEPSVLLPLQQVSASSATLVVHTPSGLDRRALREVLRAADPALLIDSIRTISDRVGATHWRQRVVAVVLATLAVLGLVLAIFGTWATITLDISRRRRAIGVRLALGADPTRLIRDLTRSIGADAMIGVALGVGLLFVFGAPLRGLLFDMSLTDPLMLAMASTGLVTLAFVVARLAADAIRLVDPAELLRDGDSS